MEAKCVNRIKCNAHSDSLVAQIVHRKSNLSFEGSQNQLALSTVAEAQKASDSVRRPAQGGHEQYTFPQVTVPF